MPYQEQRDLPSYNTETSAPVSTTPSVARPETSCGPHTCAKREQQTQTQSPENQERHLC